MDKFIKKLETENYEIGSFDAYIDNASSLIKNKYNISDEEVSAFLKEMPTTYRASILNKKGEYLGFVGIKNVDMKNEKADIVFEVSEEFDVNKSEILEEYKMYLTDCIGLRKIDRKIKNEKSNIIKAKYIKPGIEEKTLAKFKEMYPDMPNLSLPVTLSMNGIDFGVVGLSNMIRTNRRADLRIYIDKAIESYDSEFISELINQYLSYAHNDNIWNINYEVGADERKLVEAADESKLSYYGTIPFADLKGDKIGNTLMYQHTPQILYNDSAIKSEIYVNKSIFDTDKEEMDETIELDNGYKMLKPELTKDMFLAGSSTPWFEEILQDFSKAMSNRDRFTIPLGDDKYFPQVGNDKYGLYKALMNYNYIILDKDNKFSGFINILRGDSAKKHCEIEIGVVPEKQGEGIGTMALNAFYDQLFSIGYASVTSKVFNFNDRSNNLFTSNSEYNGRRIQSYYVNGNIYDMNVYTKLNPLVEGVKIR